MERHFTPTKIQIDYKYTNFNQKELPVRLPGGGSSYLANWKLGSGGNFVGFLYFTFTVLGARNKCLKNGGSWRTMDGVEVELVSDFFGALPIFPDVIFCLMFDSVSI